MLFTIFTIFAVPMPPVWRQDPLPGIDIEFRQTDLDEGGHFGQGRQAALAGDRDRLELAALDVRARVGRLPAVCWVRSIFAMDLKTAWAQELPDLRAQSGSQRAACSICC